MTDQEKKEHINHFLTLFIVPQNDEEALAHGNALAASGNYPVGTSACFNVGISGGCGEDCFVYQRGDCPEPDEIIILEELDSL